MRRPLADFLRRVHPASTQWQVEAATGIPARTVERWLDGGALPSLPHFLKLMDAYGPELIAALAPEASGWLSAAVAHERRRALAARADEIKRQLEELDRT